MSDLLDMWIDHSSSDAMGGEDFFDADNQKVGWSVSNARGGGHDIYDVSGELVGHALVVSRWEQNLDTSAPSSLVGWDSDAEDRALGFCRAHLDLASHGFDEVFGDGEAKPCATELS